eukprot:TRINITY_DN1186_c0_g1_i1.p1 TRINITY_DN1186_c0_g1~~TRINITY_DN1186_c0_g1_i1.p1  ORF type:complete len:494 (+),score=118.08 TRINITY_DN1186_c0_g1_i1:24-1484(+)
MTEETWQLIEDGRLSEAEAILTAHLEGASAVLPLDERIPYLAQRGHARRILGNHEGAVEDLSVLLQFVQRKDGHAPSSAFSSGYFVTGLEISRVMLLEDRAFCYLQLGEFHSALNDFDEILVMSPDNYRVLNKRAKLKMDVFKMTKEAIADFDLALEKSKSFAPAYYGRGRAYESMEEFELAVLDYEEAVKYYVIQVKKSKSVILWKLETMFEAYYRLARIYLKMSRFQECIQKCGEVLAHLGQVRSQLREDFANQKNLDSAAHNVKYVPYLLELFVVISSAYIANHEHEKALLHIVEATNLCMKQQKTKGFVLDDGFRDVCVRILLNRIEALSVIPEKKADMLEVCLSTSLALEKLTHTENYLLYKVRLLYWKSLAYEAHEKNQEALQCIEEALTYLPNDQILQETRSSFLEKIGHQPSSSDPELPESKDISLATRAELCIHIAERLSQSLRKHKIDLTPELRVELQQKMKEILVGELHLNQRES